MLIPSIDLMGGKIVQLVQGERKALEFENFDEWIGRLSPYPLVQLIDLDAAMGNGSNRGLVKKFADRLPCQVGGGIRSAENAEAMLAAGAKRVIIGSTLVRDGKPDPNFAEQLARVVGSEVLVFAIDSRRGKVAIRGWREITPTTPVEMMSALAPWCGAFLYTHIDTEGLMQGMPLDVVTNLRSSTRNRLIVAGGITTAKEIEQLEQMGVDAVVGMAIYTGRMKLSGSVFAIAPGREQR